VPTPDTGNFNVGAASEYRFMLVGAVSDVTVFGTFRQKTSNRESLALPQGFENKRLKKCPLKDSNFRPTD